MKRKILNRIFSMLMCVVLVLAMFPTSVFASNEDNAKNALTYLMVNNVNILNGGTVEGVSFDAETSTLTLENAVIDTVNSTGDEDGIFAVGDINIVLKGNNVIEGEGINNGIDVSPGNLNIYGDGSLSVKTGYYGIYASENINISGSVDINSFGDEKGIYSRNKNITIGGQRFYSLKSEVVIEDGILVKSSLPLTKLWVNNVDILNGGTVKGVSFDKDTSTLTLENAVIDTVCDEGLNDGIYVEGDLNIVLKGNNVIKGDKLRYGINAYPGSLNFTGDGSLNVETFVIGINAEGSINIGDAVDITAFGTEAGVFSTTFDLNIGKDKIYNQIPKIVIEDGVLVEKSSPITELWVNNVDIYNGGTVEGVSFDKNTSTLTLENAVIDTPCDNGENAGIYSFGDINVVLKGKNVIKGEGIRSGIKAFYGDLNITGDGELTVEVEYNALWVGNDMEISGTVDITAYGKDAAIYKNDTYVNEPVIIGGKEFAQSIPKIVIENGVLVETSSPLTELWVNNVDVYNGGTVEGVSFDKDTSTLTLENAVIDTENDLGKGININGDINIIVKGTNIISGDDIIDGIYSREGIINIDGDGYLKTEGKSTGITARSDINISETVSLTAIGENSAFYSLRGTFTLAGKPFTTVAKEIIIEKGVLKEAKQDLKEIWVNNVDILNGGKVDGVNYDAVTNTLTLENVVIDTPHENSSAGIYADGNLNIVLKGENIISGEGMMSGIDSQFGNLSINGDGSLTVEAQDYAIASMGFVYIGDKVDLTLFGENSGSFNAMSVFIIPSTNNAFLVWNGINENDTVLYKNGPITKAVEFKRFFNFDLGYSMYYPYVRIESTPVEYSISSSVNKIDFGNVSENYDTAPKAQTVTITNTGNFAVELTQPSAVNYNISTLSNNVLNPGETATFTIQPKAGLGAGNYDEQITVYADSADEYNGSSSNDEQNHEAFVTVNVLFIVEAENGNTNTDNTDNNDTSNTDKTDNSLTSPYTGNDSNSVILTAVIVALSCSLASMIVLVRKKKTVK